jgi:hypothetical protein
MKLFCKRMILGLMAMTISASAMSGTSAKTLPQTKADPQVVSKLAQILERSGYPYKKAADNVWVVSFKGNSKPDIQVFVTSAENLIVMGTVVAAKASMKVTPELMFKLLRIVDDIDRVKIGFDDDEDLFLRAEVTNKCFDVESFKSSMDQISAGTDKVYAAIKTSLVP